jgi:hypothetical protein
MTLAELQQQFQDAILGEAPTLALIAQLRSPRAGAEEAFAVYRESYHQRLAEFLANDFPCLRAAMGEAAFAELAEAYIAAQPSHDRNARWYGAGLPGFLDSRDQLAAPRFSRAMAHFEAALAEAFDAADELTLRIASLAGFKEVAWPRLKFAFHPSFRLVEAPASLPAWYEAFQAGDDQPAIAADAPEGWVSILIWRHADEVSYRLLDALEAMALGEARDGRSFGEICGQLALACPQADRSELSQAAAGYLVRWFADEMIVQSAPGPVDPSAQT